jgi:hypothetical protein
VGDFEVMLEERLQNVVRMSAVDASEKSFTYTKSCHFDSATFVAVTVAV